MLKQFTHSQVYVLDQDAALEFYTGPVGLEKRADADMGFMRWLTVGSPDQPDVEINLMAVGPPLPPADHDVIRDLVTKGSLNSLIFATDDLEQDRAGLLQRAGASLGVTATEVTLERLCALVTPGAAELARTRSAELRGLLAEIAREHGINRALMRQELAFLSHLTRLLGGDAEPGYKPTGDTGTAPASHHVLDLQA